MSVMPKKKPHHVVIFLLFRILSFCIFILPLSLGLKIGQCLGKLIFYFLKKERKKAISNLDIAFGDSKSQEEKEDIARQVFENLGKNLVEVISLSKFNSRNIDRYIACKGLENIEQFLKQGKGGIALSAHFGNWELLAHYFGIKGYSVNVIARRVRMDRLEGVLRKIRKRNNVNVIYRDTSSRSLFSLIKKNQFIAMMPDQDMDGVSGVFVDFFGKKAYTPNGVAVLNYLTGIPVIPCFIVRKKYGHEIRVEKPLELTKTQDKDRDIVENTQRYTKAIEDYVREFPSQWVWFHNRWKTRPGSCN